MRLGRTQALDAPDDDVCLVALDAQQVQRGFELEPLAPATLVDALHDSIESQKMQQDEHDQSVERAQDHCE